MGGKRCWREKGKIMAERGETDKEGKKMGAQKRPSEQERQRGRAVRFSFVVVGE